MSDPRSGFVAHGDGWRKVTYDTSNIKAKLPKGYYAIRHDPLTGMYLDRVEPYKLPEKVYGQLTKQRTDRILRSFEKRTGNTGVLAAGEKGSGKTLLIKSAAHAAYEQGYSVVHIDGKSPSMQSLADYLSNFGESLVVVIDEFEKIVDDESQVHMLSMLDGLAASKHLFLLSSNDGNIDDRMMNRPGRVYYYFEYGSLEPAFVRDYVTDHLDDKDMVDKLCEALSIFQRLNFDIMAAVVQEMNFYKEQPLETLRWLNASPAFEDSTGFKIKVFADGCPVELYSLHAATSPVLDGQSISVHLNQVIAGSHQRHIEPEPEFRKPTPLVRCIQAVQYRHSLTAGDFVKFEKGEHVYELKRSINMAYITKDAPAWDELPDDDDDDDDTKMESPNGTAVAAQAKAKRAKAKRVMETLPDDFVTYTLQVRLIPNKFRRAHGFAGGIVDMTAADPYDD